MTNRLLNKKCTGLAALVVIGWLAFANPAQAASFDCAKAQSKVEKMICEDTELPRLDDELALSYKITLQEKTNAEEIKTAQKLWLKERNACAEKKCVLTAYESRLLALRQLRKSAQITPKINSETVKTGASAACLTPRIDWRNYEWSLIAGKGLPVCDEMLEYLQSRPKDMAPPTCPAERLPPNSNWSRPEQRFLSEAEKQAILRDIPAHWRKRHGTYPTVERWIAGSKTLRIIRSDITGDGLPDYLLGLGSHENPLQLCETSKRCANPYPVFKGGIVLSDDGYEVYPMNEDGTRVAWGHKAFGFYGDPKLGGEIIYYKGQPHLLGSFTWSQNSNDDFTHTSIRPGDPLSSAFTLGKLYVSTGKPEVKPPHFKDLVDIAGDYDPESPETCRFGYFHRNNLLQNPPKSKD